MKLLYLAGPFSAPAGDPDPLHAVEANVLAASRIALEAARAGWMPITPHKNSQGFHHCSDIPPEFWYAGDLALLRRCDAVLMLPGWEGSRGAVAERDAALAAGLPVLYPRLPPVPAPGEVFP